MIDFLTWQPFGPPTAPIWAFIALAGTLGLPVLMWIGVIFYDFFDK